MNRPTWHIVFMEILEVIARRSLCLKMQTAALIVRDTQILAIGYNGTFSKHLECNDHWRAEHKRMQLKESFDEWIITDEFKKLHREWSKANEIHGEANALKWISRADTEGCIMYTLYSPCSACAKDIIAHGIKHVYYKYKYKHGDDALGILDRALVHCMQIN